MDLKTTREAVGIINLSQRRIAELCDEGKEFPSAFKKGDMWLIPEEELLIYKTKHPKNNKRGVERVRKAQDNEFLQGKVAEATASRIQSDEVAQ